MRKLLLFWCARFLWASLWTLVPLALGASAHEEFFAAELTNANEPPVNGQPVTPRLSDGVTPRPVSFGSAFFALNDLQNAMTMTATVHNIDLTGSQTADTFDNLVAAHIHAGSSISPTAPVKWGFFGQPDNDTNPDDLVVTPFVGAVGGTITSKWDLNEGNNGTTLSAELDFILNQRAYLNFHTIQYGGGEIRGTLVSAPIPEPAAGALAGIGLLGVVGLALRRRNVAAASSRRKGS
jgi:hypothetical protein